MSATQQEILDAVNNLADEINTKMEVPDNYNEIQAIVDDFETILGDVELEGDNNENYDSEGRWIDPKLLAEGRAEEMRWLEKAGVFETVPIEQAKEQ